MSFIKRGTDSKIINIIGEEELTDEQKKAAKEMMDYQQQLNHEVPVKKPQAS